MKQMNNNDNENLKLTGWKRFKEIVWLTFCEADEKYLDLFRICYALGIVSFLLFAGYSIMVLGNIFDAVAFGTGFGSLLFGGGVGVGLRGKFEDGTGNNQERGKRLRG